MLGIPMALECRVFACVGSTRLVLRSRTCDTSGRSPECQVGWFYMLYVVRLNFGSEERRLIDWGWGEEI